MKSAFPLLIKVIRGRVHPRVIFHGLRNTLSRTFRPGRRRFEFERLFLEHGDIWEYATSPYEQKKYAETLRLILRFAPRRESILELGCAVGVFSRMVSEHFERVVASDFSREAIALARKRCTDVQNVSFVQSYMQTLRLRHSFDVIVCAECLYYVLENETTAILELFESHLKPDGIIVLVYGEPSGECDADHFHGWPRILANHFNPILDEKFSDPPREYRIAIYGRK
jgi:SAM-dependent methyltransferase